MSSIDRAQSARYEQGKSRTISQSKGRSIVVSAWLLVYNVLSGAAWTRVLLTTIRHLFSSLKDPKAGNLSSELVQASKMLHAKTSVPRETSILLSLALLETVHATLGWTGTSVVSSLMQNAGRLYEVWVVLDKSQAVRRLYALG